MGDSEPLERYVNDPVINRLTAPENKLYRPETDYAKAARLACLCCLFCFLVSYAIAVITLRYTTGPWDVEVTRYAMRVFPFVLVVALVVCSRFILIWFVRLYQRYASAEIRLRCCFTPSCSEYTILALRKYGTVIGGIKSVNRLIRCKAPGGIDYP